MLKVKDLTIEPLFREVNFCVPRGEIVTLMGPSGSGKSTLFAWMVGALSDDFQARGELWLDARRCDGLPVESRGLGILFQDALLFEPFSVGQNLLLALPERIVGRARREAVEQALDSAGLSGHYASDPATLSGGETFLASLSLALGLADVVQEYAGGVHLDAMFIDEGFGSLDSESLDLAMKTLQELKGQNRLIGLISHVGGLEERIPAKLRVTKTQTGSTAAFEVG